MTYGKTREDQFILRLERGEDVIEMIKAFCREHGINNASVVGIGSIDNPVLAHYKVDDKKYSEKKFEGAYEVTSLLGNVALFEYEPLLHPHITIGDEHMNAYAGHLVSGTTSATMEIFLTALPSHLVKKHNEEIGLKLFELPQRDEEKS